MAKNVKNLIWKSIVYSQMIDFIPCALEKAWNQLLDKKIRFTRFFILDMVNSWRESNQLDSAKYLPYVTTW